MYCNGIDQVKYGLKQEANQLLFSVYAFLVWADNKSIDPPEDMVMLEAIKRIIQQRASNTGETALAEYYRSRLAATRNVIEEEAIIYMSSLLSLYDWDAQDNKESK